MCLAIPGKVIALHDTNGVRMARVDFGGITRDACLEYLPETLVGEYVMVHVGFAIARVDEEEAARTYQYLEEMDQLGEILDADPEPDPEHVSHEERGSCTEHSSYLERNDEVP